MINPNEVGFNPGAIVDAPDERDFNFGEFAMGLAPFDWNKGYDVEAEIGALVGDPNFKLTVKDQGGSGSCGGQAWSYHAEAIEAFYTKTYEPRSAKFIYAQTFVPGGGSDGRTNSNIFINQGVAREAVLSSYDAGNAPTEAFMERVGDITAEARTDAKNDKAAAYMNTTIDIDAIAQAVQANKGVIIGVVGSNNGTWLSAQPQPPKDASEAHWYHWLYIGKAKLINGVKFVGVCNSWGKDTGEEGWQWLSEAYINTMLPHDPDKRAIFGTWTHTYNPTPVTAFKHAFNANLVFGETGEEVRALQMALQADGEFPKGFDLSPAGYPTPYFGNTTAQAVLAFQLKYAVDTTANLQTYDGKSVGPKTRTKLNALFNN